MSEIKLSPKQKEVIRLMREGFKLNANKFGNFTINDIHIQTIQVANLLSKALINSTFKLTELGKSIQL